MASPSGMMGGVTRVTRDIMEVQSEALEKWEIDIRNA